MIWRAKAALREALAALRSGDYAIAELDILEALEILSRVEENQSDVKLWCWP